MARGTWDLYRKIAEVWTYEGTIYRPNASLPLTIKSNLIKTQLADGSYGYITPETKYNINSLKLTWGYIDKTYRDQLEVYVENLYDMRITDHNTTVYYGRFTDITSTWLVGEENKYDITVQFEVIPLFA